MKSVRLSTLTAVATLVAAPGLMGQTMVHLAQGPVGRVQVPRVQLNLLPQLRTSSSNVRIAGFQAAESATLSTSFCARERRLGKEQRGSGLRRKPEPHPSGCGRIQTGWRRAKTFWIKTVSSKCHSRQVVTISSSATTKFDRFRQLFGDSGSIPVRSTESSDLKPSERSKITRSRTSCR